MANIGIREKKVETMRVLRGYIRGSLFGWSL